MSEASGEGSPGEGAASARPSDRRTSGRSRGAPCRRRSAEGAGEGTGSCGAREAQPSLAGHPILGLGFLK